MRKNPEWRAKSFKNARDDPGPATAKFILLSPATAKFVLFQISGLYRFRGSTHQVTKSRRPRTSAVRVRAMHVGSYVQSAAGLTPGGNHAAIRKKHVK